jgi:hypothetical protein
MDPQLLFGLAALVSALASLVWALRRKPNDGRADDAR